MNFPLPENTLIAAVDLQERLLPVIANQEQVVKRCAILLQGAKELGMNVLVSEQYPKGLGHTVPELSCCFTPGTAVVEKRAFSLFKEPAFVSALEEKAPKSLILCGVESHICVLQSLLDARNAGLEVILAADGVSSRSVMDRELALAAARQAGAQVLSVESILFMLLRDSAHPAFKAISKLIK